jgi:hypothetical protein
MRLRLSWPNLTLIPSTVVLQARLQSSEVEAIGLRPGRDAGPAPRSDGSGRLVGKDGLSAWHCKMLPNPAARTILIDNIIAHRWYLSQVLSLLALLCQ